MLDHSGSAALVAQMEWRRRAEGSGLGQQVQVLAGHADLVAHQSRGAVDLVEVREVHPDHRALPTQTHVP